MLWSVPRSSFDIGQHLFKYFLNRSKKRYSICRFNFLTPFYPCVASFQNLCPISTTNVHFLFSATVNQKLSSVFSFSQTEMSVDNWFFLLTNRSTHITHNDNHIVRSATKIPYLFFNLVVHVNRFLLRTITCWGIDLNKESFLWRYINQTAY